MHNLINFFVTAMDENSKELRNKNTKKEYIFTINNVNCVKLNFKDHGTLMKIETFKNKECEIVLNDKNSPIHLVMGKDWESFKDSKNISYTKNSIDLMVKIMETYYYFD